MEKIHSIQSMATFLKDSLQTVPLRMLTKFIGMCSATHPAVFQAPAHYRHMQFVKSLVLMNSLNPIEAYNKEVYLNEKPGKIWLGGKFIGMCLATRPAVFQASAPPCINYMQYL